ncbi:MAG: hypothetical protein AAF563_05235 [Pseudomonadota bacterium]
MSLLLFLGVPLIFVGGCLTAAGFIRPGSHAFISGYGPKQPVGSRAYRQPFDPGSRKRRITLGLKLFAVGAVLVVVAGL